jgi:hypothetical protein
MFFDVVLTTALARQADERAAASARGTKRKAEGVASMLCAAST